MSRNAMPLKARAKALAILGQAITFLPGVGEQSPRYEYKPEWDDRRVAEETAQALGLQPNDPCCTRRHIQYMRQEIYGKFMTSPGELDHAPMREAIETLAAELRDARAFMTRFAESYNELRTRLGEPPIELP